MIYRRTFPVLAVGVWISTVGVLAGAPEAWAQQRPGAPAHNPCAVYGADFVAVQGTSSCVRIGGRVRLEVSRSVTGNAYAPSPAPAGALMAPFGAGSPGAPASGDGLNRAHLRLGAPPGARR